MMLTRDKRLGLLLLQAVVLLPLWLDFPVGVLLLCAAAMVDLARRYPDAKIIKIIN